MRTHELAKAFDSLKNVLPIHPKDTSRYNNFEGGGGYGGCAPIVRYGCGSTPEKKSRLRL